jgi:hypothetical protein
VQAQKEGLPQLTTPENYNHLVHRVNADRRGTLALTLYPPHVSRADFTLGGLFYQVCLISSVQPFSQLDLSYPISPVDGKTDPA